MTQPALTITWPSQSIQNSCATVCRHTLRGRWALRCVFTIACCTNRR